MRRYASGRPLIMTKIIVAVMAAMTGRMLSLLVPAGLVLYWVTSNLLQLIQQYFATNYTAALAQGGDKRAEKKA